MPRHRTARRRRQWPRLLSAVDSAASVARRRLASSAALRRPRRPFFSAFGLSGLGGGGGSLGHERQVEREDAEQRDRRGGTVDAEQPAPGAVQAEPDLADRGPDDQHAGQHVQPDRRRPQAQRQLRGAQLGPTGAQQREHHRQRREADEGARDDAQHRAKRVGRVCPSAPASAAERKRSTRRRPRSRTTRAKPPQLCGSYSSSDFWAGERPAHHCPLVAPRTECGG